MSMLSNEKIKFKSLEEKIFKEMMKLGRKIIQDELRMLDKLILDYRDKEVFKPKDFQPTTIKTKLGEIPIARRRYKMVINGETKLIYLLLEEEKVKLYEEGKIEGEKETQYIFCEHDGIYIKKQKSKKHKGKKKIKVRHFKKRKSKKKKNGIELKIVVIHEGKEPRYTNDYKLKNKVIVGTASKEKDLKKIEDATIGITYKEHTIKNVVINGDGADWTGSIVEGAKEIFQLDMAHI